MAGNAKKQVQDMIRRRAKKFEEYRTNSSRKLTPQQTVFKFFKSFEEIRRSSIDTLDFQSKLDSECRLLNSRLQTFDYFVNIELVWHKVEEAANWEELRLNGVRIIWSPDYIKVNPDVDQEIHVDVTHYLLEGLED